MQTALASFRAAEKAISLTPYIFLGVLCRSRFKAKAETGKRKSCVPNFFLTGVSAEKYY
jgi:hypothetical protein